MDEPAHPAHQMRRWPFYVVGVVLGVGATLTGVLIAATHPPHHEQRSGPVYVAVFASVAAVLVAALVVWSIRRQFNRSTTKRLHTFSLAQRRGAARAVNSGARLTDEQHSIAEAQFEQLSSSATRMRWALLVAVVAFGLLAVANTGGLRGLWVALVALELLSAISSVLLLRRQRRRLEKALAAL